MVFTISTNNLINTNGQRKNISKQYIASNFRSCIFCINILTNENISVTSQLIAKYTTKNANIIFQNFIFNTFLQVLQAQDHFQLNHGNQRDVH